MGSPKRWLIRYVDARHDLWWRASRSGYTNELLAAGLYTEEEAKAQEASRPEHDRAVPLSEALCGAWSPGTVGGLLSSVDGSSVVDALRRLRERVGVLTPGKPIDPTEVPHG